ncbi:MAG: hypothetical protein ACJA1C_001835 [Crocinitomicaceae bacterium]|jgi:hypothetical protein
MKKKSLLLGKAILVMSAVMLSNFGQAQINTFPHVEDFEANDGGWVAGGTSSSWAHGVPSGPYINGTVGCGSNAWVTNLSGDYNNNEESQIESPVYDFTALTTDPILKFDHIYETEGCCDEGWVEFSIDGGTTWTKLGTSVSGISNWYNDGGNDWWDGNSGATGAWRTASHTLTGLSGESNVKLRFKFSSDGSAVRDGFGVDNIIVHDGINDISVDAFVQPGTMVGAFSATETIEVTYSNFGSFAAAAVDLCYVIDGGTPVCETFLPALAPGASTTSTFAVPADLSGLGNHDISVYYSNVSEDYLCNDTITMTVTTIQILNSFPYLEDFEAGDGGYTGGGSANSWEHGVPNAPFIDGTVGCGVNAWVTNLTGDYLNNSESQLESVPFDFSGLATDPMLRFDHIFETEGCCDEGWVEFSIDGGATWAKLGTSLSGQNWYNDVTNDWWDGTSGAAGQWRSASHVLTGLAGESNVKIRFRVSTDGSAVRDGFGVDNIMIYENLNDLAVDGFVTPSSTPSGFGAAEAIEVTITNSGSSTLATVDLCYVLDGGTPVCETFSPALAVGTSTTVTFTVPADLSVLGNHNIVVYNSSASEDYLCNDTINISVTTIPVISTFPYFEDFEAGDGSWSANSSWEHGVPTGTFITGSADCGVNAWVTNLAGAYGNNTNEALTSMPLDFSGLATDPILRFDHIYETEGCCDEGWVEYSIDGGATWTKLGTSLTGLDNWYNDAGNDWWDGNSGLAGDWRTAAHVLTGLAGESDVRVRFMFSSDGSATEDGFGVDNILIYEDMEVADASPMALVSQIDGCSLSATEVFSIDVMNNGADSLTTLDVCYSIDGGAVVCETIAIVIAPDSTETVNLVGTADLSAAGTYSIEFVTGHAGDFYGCNDTLVVSVTNTIIVGAETVTDASCNGSNDGEIDLAVSGTAGPFSYDWSTSDTLSMISGLTANTYGVLITDSITGCTDTMNIVITEPTAIVSSTVVVDLNCNGDADGEIDLTVTGGTPAYTFVWDNAETTEDLTGLIGGTYEVIITDNNGCNDTITATVAEPTAIVLSATVVDETLGSDGSIDLTVTGGTSPYTFAWDNGAGTVEDPSGLVGNTTYFVTVTDDNGCVDTLSVFVTSFVGISELENNFNVHVYPNPNNGEFVVEMDEASEGTIEVFSMTGQLVIAKALNNQSTIAFDLNNIEAGIYTLNVMTLKGKATLRLVIQ